MDGRRWAILLAGLAIFAAGCGDEEESGGGATTAAAQEADLSAVRTYLTQHSADLAARTAELGEKGEAYYELAKGVDFDYDALLAEHRDEVAKLLEESKQAYIAANPAYEQMEGIVAGVSSLAEYDVIIDAGSSGDDPENAVPFDLKLPDGKTMEKPGNFMFLTETSLYGTNQDLLAEGVEADLDDDGKVSFGEALPEANFYVAMTKEFERYAKELDEAANEFEPTPSDAFSALVVMTPTMSEYFEAWKNSRFVAGSNATEEAFVAASRLQDISDILGGLVLTYDNIQPLVEENDPEQAQQTGEELKALEQFAADLRDKEADGKKYTAEEADTLGSQAQERAEAIAGQVTQAAAKLNIEIDEG